VLKQFALLLFDVSFNQYIVPRDHRKKMSTKKSSF